MATAGATPPSGAPAKPKREFTTVQKAGMVAIPLLALAVAFIYFPRGSQAPAPTPTPPPTMMATSLATVAPVATTGAPRTTAPSTSATPAPNVEDVFISPARSDPFQEVLLYPPPPPPAPKPAPPPVTVQDPGDILKRNPVEIAIPDPKLREAVAQPLGIGSPSIRRTSDGPPRDAQPLPRTTTGGVGGTVQPSYDKRLAGVLIGEGVRALIEVTANGQTTTRVVQPGDEFDGIKILSIDRVRNGDKVESRMLIRDTDGTQRTVELRAGAAQAAGPGGIGGPGGFPGAGGFPGGFPGGGFPGGGFPGGAPGG